MSSFRGKILVIRGGAIGDFILTLPVLTALRRQFPDASVEVLGYKHIIQLAVAAGLANKGQPIESRSLAEFFARNGTLSEDWADYFSEFDLIVSYLYDPDEIFQANVRRCTPAQFIAGPHRPDDKKILPASRVFLQPLERLAIFEADPVPHLALPRTLKQANYLALHPGSGSEKKNWAIDRWAELLARLLSETRFGLLLVGGEAEGERLQQLAAALPPSRIRVAHKLPLPELATQLAASQGFIGHDSGISHLAAALGLPGLVLWADTVEEVWRPPSGKVRILRDPAGLACLTVERVMQDVAELWAEKVIS